MSKKKTGNPDINDRGGIRSLDTPPPADDTSAGPVDPEHLAILAELVQQAADAEAAAKKADEEAVNTKLANSINSKYTTRMGFRKYKETEMLEGMKLYLGSLASYSRTSHDYPFAEARQDNRPEFNIVRNKCNLAMAQTITNQFGAGDKNWSLKAPPVADVDDYDIQQTAQAQGNPNMTPEEVSIYRTDLMEKEIENDLIDARYGIEVRKAMSDRIVLGTGILKGPKNVGKLKKIYKKTQTSDGRVIRIPTFVEEKKPVIYRVNPWFFYPDESATNVNEAEDAIEVHMMTPTQLKEYLNHPGFKKDQIEAVLAEAPREYANNPYADPANLTSGTNVSKNKYMVLEYHGPIDKSDLAAAGVIDLVDTPLNQTWGEVWVVNNRVIRLDTEDVEGTFRIPYYMCTWEPDPASPFGYGIPMLTRDQQRVVNETFKMILDNAGISAGPQVVVDTTLIKPADGNMACTPWKVWYSTEFGGDVTKAIQFFIPTNAFEGLSQLLSMSREFADEESSIQSLLGGGMGSPSAADGNATQMMIMNQNATAPLFLKAEDWDDNITFPVIQGMYDWEMQYNPKDEIKCGCEIDVRTSTSYLRGLMEQSKLDKLSMEIAQGSPIGEWINMDELAITRLATMKLPYRGMIKSAEQVAQERANRPPAPPDANMLKYQAEMAKIEVDKTRVANEQQQLQLDATKSYQEAMMQYQAQLRTDEVRQFEAQASILKARFDFLAQYTQLAQNDVQHRDKLVAQIRADTVQDETTKLLAGMDFAKAKADQALKEKELELKAKGKTGITSVK